jgi:FHA domain
MELYIVTPNNREEPVRFPDTLPLTHLLESLVQDPRMEVSASDAELLQLVDSGKALDSNLSLSQNGVSSGSRLMLQPKKQPTSGGAKEGPGGTRDLLRCPNGHYYDPKKHTKCPHCGIEGIEFPGDGGKAAGRQRGSGDTRPAHYPSPSPAPRDGGGDPATQTVILTNDEGGIDPVVGWLIAVIGPDRGRDYRIRSENNAIGRSKDMDIYIASDPAISRERHAVVTFDPQRSAFYLIPGEVRGSVYLNGELVLGHQKLSPYDRILLGKTTLMFVPFCGEKFKWE